jgi:hypothetical protein
MFKFISSKSGLAALTVAALAIGASAGVATPAAAKNWGGGHGGHGGGHGGHGGHGHWGGHGGGHGHWGGHGPRFGYHGYYGPRRVYVRDCYRVWRRVFIPGEGYVKTRVRVCD